MREKNASSDQSFALKLPPPLILILIAAAMYGLASALPEWQLTWPKQLRFALAGLGMLSGITLGVLGVRDCCRHRTTVLPQKPEKTRELVSDGIFAHTRNPMYLGMVLGLMGWGLYLANPLTLLGVVVFVLWLHCVQIKMEERALLKKFGEPYEHYLQRVRRWF